MRLTKDSVRGITHLGGTILGTTNRGNPAHFPNKQPDGTYTEIDRTDELIGLFTKHEIDALIAIGGDGSLGIANILAKKGLLVIGVPKTIDNDLDKTVVTFGFDSAVEFTTECLDRLHSTAEAHQRVMIVEVMGRYAGWIALGAGLAGGADVSLIPEIPFDWEKVFEYVTDRHFRGGRFSIVCVAEGAKPADGELVVKEKDKKRTDPVRLGGIGDLVGRKITEGTGLETRVTVLGHVQRGGSPTPYDRILATRFGSMALQLASQGRFGCMVSLQGTEVVSVPVKEAILKLRTVPPDSQLILAARAVGTCFGD